MTKFIAGTFFFLFPFFVSAQDALYNPEEYIAWSPDIALSWDLYTASSGMAFGDAGTVVKIQAKPVMDDGKIIYYIHALFNKKKSWYKEKSDELLAHEQVHFDIAELTARQVRKKVQELKKANVKDLKIYNQEIKKILNESNRFDDAYDKETLHGMLDDKQKEWEQRVENELKILRYYQHADISIN